MPHVMELFGKTRVVVKDGKVVETGEPIADWCPVSARFQMFQNSLPGSKKKYGIQDKRTRDVHP